MKRYCANPVFVLNSYSYEDYGDTVDSTALFHGQGPNSDDNFKALGIYGEMVVHPYFSNMLLITTNTAQSISDIRGTIYLLNTTTGNVLSNLIAASKRDQ